MLLKGLISLIFGQKNGNFKQILVSNWVSLHLMEVSVSVSVSKFYSWKVSVSISVSKFHNRKVSVSYRYRISIPAWYQYRISIEKSGIEDLCHIVEVEWPPVCDTYQSSLLFLLHSSNIKKGLKIVFVFFPLGKGASWFKPPIFSSLQSNAPRFPLCKYILSLPELDGLMCLWCLTGMWWWGVIKSAPLKISTTTFQI